MLWSANGLLCAVQMSKIKVLTVRINIYLEYSSLHKNHFLSKFEPRDSSRACLNQLLTKSEYQLNWDFKFRNGLELHVKFNLLSDICLILFE